MERHRVAVTVFVEVDAVDAVDATDVAEAAVRQAFMVHRTGRGPGYLVLPFAVRRQDGVNRVEDVHVHGIMETGRAARNGLLWISPTTEAFRKPEGG